jgi:hypothetical protein
MLASPRFTPSRIRMGFDHGTVFEGLRCRRSFTLAKQPAF